jgi:preprotein translocase subunit SecA
LAFPIRKAQCRVERTHLRQRMVLLHRERERRAVQKQLGQDPYLDSLD